MYSATAYNHAYNDSGIFCIHASSHPQSLVELTQVGFITTWKPPTCWNNLITAERKMIRAGIGARVSGDNRKNLSGGIGQSEDTGFVPIVRLVSILFLSWSRCCWWTWNPGLSFLRIAHARYEANPPHNCTICKFSQIWWRIQYYKYLQIFFPSLRPPGVSSGP